MCHCQRNLPKTFRSGCEVTKESEFISGQSPAVDKAYGKTAEGDHHVILSAFASFIPRDDTQDVFYFHP